jgi:signal transduction histidine kinase
VVRRTRDRAARVWATLGIRPIDIGATAVVAAVVELNIAVATGPGQRPLNAIAYTLGAILVIPVLFRRRWPLQVLLACTILLFVFYSTYRRNISPAPLLSLPLYDAAAAGYLSWAIVIPAVYMAIGLVVVEASEHYGLATLVAQFLPSIALLALAIALGELVRGRRILAAETAQRLRAAEEEREAEAARRVAEERLRIARDLHDTVAHSMATITVQAGSALHVLGAARPLAGGHREQIRTALLAIRATSKGALADMRATLGQLRGGEATEPSAAQPGDSRRGGLDRLPALRDAVQAAGVPVSVTIDGDSVPLPEQVDHAAYRILQESLTNVLRHAGPDATACVTLRYQPGSLTLQVIDDGVGPPTVNGPAGNAAGGGDSAGHGVSGMRERAASAGGDLIARPGESGGFEVIAHLPIAAVDSEGTQKEVTRLSQ